jgi:hypothetical protein
MSRRLGAGRNRPRLLPRGRYPMKEPQTWGRAVMLITIAAVADALANAAVEGVLRLIG